MRMPPACMRHGSGVEHVEGSCAFTSKLPLFHFLSSRSALTEQCLLGIVVALASNERQRA